MLTFKLRFPNCFNQNTPVIDLNKNFNQKSKLFQSTKLDVKSGKKSGNFRQFSPDQEMVLNK